MKGAEKPRILEMAKLEGKLHENGCLLVRGITATALHIHEDKLCGAAAVKSSRPIEQSFEDLTPALIPSFPLAGVQEHTPHKCPEEEDEHTILDTCMQSCLPKIESRASYTLHEGTPSLELLLGWNYDRICICFPLIPGLRKNSPIRLKTSPLAYG
ncbi:hypothetical protein Nepgr_015063 [Nepenthes gracilis]|uniref:Uncharacterized protein n=1 Tax=Nepenthes gracilis TaxID=150966 RepID=A0AAD3SLI5_NEPGR|nr:hypothetical protein Nepgr_015063 [Nepenthes gracilis]